MSKRDEDVPDLDEGMTTAERRRRRRRGAGLRVPSDNVPRRTNPSQPVVAPVPEGGSDPALAVAVAYSFGDDSKPVAKADASGDFERAEAEAAALIADGGEPTVKADLPIGKGVPMTAAALAAAASSPSELGAIAGEGDNAKTREMPAVQLEALGLEVPEFMDEPAGNDTVVADLEEVKRQKPVTNRALTVALSEDDLEELMDVPLTDGGERQRRLATANVAPFDEHSSPHLPVVRFSKPAPAVSEPPAEPAAEPATSDAVPNAQADTADSVDIEIEAAPAESESKEEVAARAETEPVTRKPRAASPTGEELALDDADLQDPVVEPADASDSGEILSDELIEEMEAQSAKPVPIKEQPAAAPAPAPTAAPAAPAAAAPGIVGAEEPRRGTPAPAATKPPSPPPAAPKPPPAPPKKPGAARAAAVAAAVAPPDTRENRDERRRRAKPWFEEIFDEDYLRTLPFLTPQATQAEAQFVIETLGLQPGAHVLDLGCGYGRHAMELAARGFHVVGLDLSLPLLLRGADEAQRRGLTINFVHGDMRELDFDSQFDGAYCVFSTFGFFDDETNKKTAANLARALKPGARVVLDILNRDYLISDLPTRVWWEGDGCVVLEEVEFNYFSSRVQTNRSVVFDDGRQVEQEISMRAYSLHEIGKLLHAAGFRVVEISGSMVTRGRFFGQTSRQIIVVAERRPKDPKDPANGGTSGSAKDS